MGDNFNIHHSNNLHWGWAAKPLRPYIEYCIGGHKSERPHQKFFPVKSNFTLEPNLTTIYYDNMIIELYKNMTSMEYNMRSTSVEALPFFWPKYYSTFYPYNPNITIQTFSYKYSYITIPTLEPCYIKM